MRAEITIAIAMPAIAPPYKGLGVVDCELAELELDETLPAVIVVAATVISAGALKIDVLAEAESEVDIDEEACES